MNNAKKLFLGAGTASLIAVGSLGVGSSPALAASSNPKTSLAMTGGWAHNYYSFKTLNGCKNSQWKRVQAYRKAGKEVRASGCYRVSGSKPWQYQFSYR